VLPFCRESFEGLRLHSDLISNPFHILQKHLLSAAIVELSCPAVGVAGDSLSGFKSAVIFQKIRVEPEKIAKWELRHEVGETVDPRAEFAVRVAQPWSSGGRRAPGDERQTAADPNRERQARRTNDFLHWTPRRGRLSFLVLVSVFCKVLHSPPDRLAPLTVGLFFLSNLLVLGHRRASSHLGLRPGSADLAPVLSGFHHSLARYPEKELPREPAPRVR
jgi:hypothetical protein